MYVDDGGARIDASDVMGDRIWNNKTSLEYIIYIIRDNTRHRHTLYQ